MSDDLTPALWRKSTFSNNTGACVEVADLPGSTAVRDSKHSDCAVLRFTTVQWLMFTTAVQSGQFD